MAKLIDLMPEEYQRRRREIKPRTLVVISIVLIIIPLASYFGLRIYLDNFKNKVQDLENQILLLESQVSSETLQKLLSLEKQLRTISFLLDQHLYWSNMFKTIEGLTLPKVKFDNFSGDMNQITLKAMAPSYAVLTEQVKSFESNSENFSQVDFSNVFLSRESSISFDLTLALTEKALKLKR